MHWIEEVHPHDTLCGCSTDEVAHAMDVRQESVQAQVQALVCMPRLRTTALKH